MSVMTVPNAWYSMKSYGNSEPLEVELPINGSVWEDSIKLKNKFKNLYQYIHTYSNVVELTSN